MALLAESACSPSREGASRADGYARRQPELTVLHRTLSAHWPAFVEQSEQLGGLPKFVMREVQAYLDCGILERGCAALECMRCGKSLLVAFSCKCRGFCPSCCGRRMNDAALHLVQRVIPEVPVRQWVCTLPWQLRYALGYDRKLCATVLGAFVTELSRSYKRRAKREHGLPSISQLCTGAVTFVQRVDGACRLNVHAHTVSLDGVYLHDEQQSELKFLPLSEPTEHEVEQLAQRVAARIERVLRKAGRYLDAQDGGDDHVDRDDGAEDQLALAEPALSACYQAAALLTEEASSYSASAQAGPRCDYCSARQTRTLPPRRPHPSSARRCAASTSTHPPPCPALTARVSSGCCATPRAHHSRKNGCTSFQTAECVSSSKRLGPTSTLHTAPPCRCWMPSGWLCEGTRPARGRFRDLGRRVVEELVLVGVGVGVEGAVLSPA
jgi:hypothetical protein